MTTETQVHGGCPTEEEMAYEERIADLQRENAELLEALRTCVDPMMRLRQGERNGATMGEISSALDAVLAAIRKAEGSDA